MKKYLKKTIIAIIATLLTSMTAFAFYEDIPTSYEYYDSIKKLDDLNLLPKDNTNMFSPEELVKLSDFYEFIITFGEIELPEEINLPYKNTENTAEYAPYLQAALDLGILKSYSLSPYFDFNKTVTKGMALSTLFENLGIGINLFYDQNKFPFEDLNPASKAAAIANKAAELGILGSEDKPEIFQNAKRISRGELADYLYKIYSFTPEPGVTKIHYVTRYAEESELTGDETFDVFENVWENLTENYLNKDDLETQSLLYGAIEGMVDETNDQYTVFQRPDQAEDFMNSLTDKFEGVGMQIDIIDGEITVVSPLLDSPAERAGIEPNDVIIEVDGVNVTEWTLTQVTSKIRGEAGTKVEITVQRGNSTKEFTITRELLSNQSVNYEIMESPNGKEIGYIHLSIFGENSYDEFEAAAEALLEEAPEGFIIDLRNNPGGYMTKAIDIVSLFTNLVKTVTILEYSDGSTEKYRTDGNGLLDGYETVLLVNGGSASASEIVTSAMKELDLAEIIGETTFGKGSVQQIIEYKDGSLLKYTISKWLTPNGNDINYKGITPDKTVNNVGGNDDQLEAALEEF